MKKCRLYWAGGMILFGATEQVRASRYSGIRVRSISQPRDIFMFARTLSSSSSLVLFAAGINLLCAGQQAGLNERAIRRGKGCSRNTLTASSHLRISSSVHPSGSPFGSGFAGNMSPPNIDQAAAAAMAPPKAVLCQWVWFLGQGPDELALGTYPG